MLLFVRILAGLTPLVDVHLGNVREYFLILLRDALLVCRKQAVLFTKVELMSEIYLSSSLQAEWLFAHIDHGEVLLLVGRES